MRAKCLEYPGSDEIFFAEAPNKNKKIKAAKRVCEQCPVTLNCFWEGVCTDSEGVWGGQTLEERINVLAYANIFNILLPTAPSRAQLAKGLGSDIPAVREYCQRLLDSL